MHRLDTNWDYNARLDGVPRHQTYRSHLPGKGNSHYDVVEDWLEVQQLPIRMVPLEARLVLSLVGRDRVTDDKGDTYTYTAHILPRATLTYTGNQFNGNRLPLLSPHQQVTCKWA